MAQFAELGFPTTRHEEWRFTNVAPLTKIPFQPVADDELDGVTAESLKQFTFGGLDCIRLVFVNGRFSGELSSIRPLHNGMKVKSFAAALDSDRERVEPYLARHAGYQDHAFVALNTAFVEDGAFVYVPPGKVVEHPLHLLFVSTSLDEPTVSHPRNLIVVGDNSQITIVESYVGLDGGLYFTNAVTEIIAAPNAVIDHCKLQQESGEAFHIAALRRSSRPRQQLHVPFHFPGRCIRPQRRECQAGRGRCRMYPQRPLHSEWTATRGQPHGDRPRQAAL